MGESTRSSELSDEEVALLDESWWTHGPGKVALERLYWKDPTLEMLEKYDMRHAETKEEFESGAHRDTDEGKGRPSLISPVLIHRLGVLLQKGAKHYGDDNWTKGMPFRRTADSMIRHIFQWLAGDIEEDHLAAVAFGCMCLMHYGSTSVGCSLDDRCKELDKILPTILTSSPPDATLKSGIANANADYMMGESDGIDPLEGTIH